MKTPEGSGNTVPRRQLARRLRALRDGLGLRQEDVARAVGISRQTLWRMECADKSVNYKRAYVEALCRRYGVDARTASVLLGLAAESKNKG